MILTVETRTQVSIFFWSLLPFPRRSGQETDFLERSYLNDRDLKVLHGCCWRICYWRQHPSLELILFLAVKALVNIF